MIDEIEYKPTKEASGGKIHLTIYPPKTFFGKGSYAVFVGGCGNGNKRTLKSAEKFLLERAIGKCDYMILKAERIIKEYSRHKKYLQKNGPPPNSSIQMNLKIG